jgi:SAM-dependent methyltransferase
VKISISSWEEAEVERSLADAKRHRGDLRASPQNIARYMQPPADTPFPLEYAFHLLGDVRGKSVLEYGCGDGKNTILLAYREAGAIGIDISPQLIDIARQRMQVNGMRADLRVASAYETGLPDASVDVVFAIAILHHLELGLARKEILRVVRPGGVLILQEPLRDSPLVWALRKMVPYRNPCVSPFERPLTTPELVAFAQGMTRTNYRRFALPYISVLKWAPASVMYWAARMDGQILNVCPWLHRYAGVVVMRLEISCR